MNSVFSPLIMVPQSPRLARGFALASSHAGQSQKNEGTPQPAPVPMKVNVWFFIEVSFLPTPYAADYTPLAMQSCPFRGAKYRGNP